MRNKRLYSSSYDHSKPEESLYIKFKDFDEKNKKKIFKTKFMRNRDFVKCDICGELLKIGTFSLYSSYFNLKGHYEHVMDFINKCTKNI